jgi:cell division septation protein DedD
MRDAERLRERRVLSLDNGQVAALLVCALLLFGGVFALGVMVGRRLAPARPAGAAAGDLAALDAAAARKPDAAPAAERHAAAAPAPASVKPAAPAGMDAPAPVRAATVAAPAARPALVVPPAAKEPVQVAPAGAVALTPPPRDVGAYTVQVGASQDRSEIARLEGRVRAAGLDPYVVEAKLGAKGTWYRVRVGSFRDKDSANRFREDVERELRTAAVVMPTR